MKLIQIPPATIPQVWPLAIQLFSTALDHSNGAVSLDQELKLLGDGKKQLWMVIDDEQKNKAVAAGVTALVPTIDGGCNAHIEMFGGHDMKSWFSVKGDFEEWAKKEGCKYIILWGRKGWVKHLKDFELTHYILRKAL